VLLTQRLGHCGERSIFASLPKADKKLIAGMKHPLEDEYVSYNVHLAPILGYETPIGVSLTCFDFIHGTATVELWPTRAGLLLSVDSWIATHAHTHT
jgi:hypothetical protein